MKKRVFSLLLALAMVLSMAPATLAAEPVTPTPPEWINPDEYVVFEGGKVYRPTYWECILQLRADALAGNRKPQRKDSMWDTYMKLSKLINLPYEDPAAVYEMELINMLYHKNEGYPSWSDNDFDMILDRHGEELSSAVKANVELWSSRWNYQMNYYGRTEAEVIQPENPNKISNLARGIDKVMGLNGMTSMDQFLDYGTLLPQGPETRQWVADALEKAREVIYVYLDGEEIVPAGGYHQLPEVLPGRAQNGRTLVPIRVVAEALGADVEWVAETSQIRLSRAGEEIVMTLGQTEAARNGTAFQMDVAPFAEAGTTFVPVRYIAEFFGQKVEWDGPAHSVLVTEDKSVAAGSNVEAWAVAMGAVLAFNNEAGSDVDAFGSMHRGKTYSQPTGNGLETIRVSASSNARYLMQSGWGIVDREALFAMVNTLIPHDGNNSEDKRQMAWDLFRVSSLAQWGYTGGYITYREALELVEPAAILIAQNFSSWKEAYESYLYGYNAWAGKDITGDIWQTPRGKFYAMIEEATTDHPIFDDTLFQTGVIGLPE